MMKFASDEVAAAAEGPVAREAVAARQQLDAGFAAQDADAVSALCAEDLIVNTPANRVARLEQVLGFFKAGRMDYESADETIGRSRRWTYGGITWVGGEVRERRSQREGKHAVELAGDGIRVDAIAPGWIDMLTKGIQEQMPDMSRRILERLPSGRWNTPDELAGLAVFLASPASNILAGVTIAADGGYSIP